MAKVLIDTSVWIEFYHPKGAAVVKEEVRAALERDDVATTTPVVVELLSGVRKKSDYNMVREDLASLIFLPLTWAEAMLGAEIAWKLARTGKRIPTMDLLVSAAAKRHGYEVWHFGDEHFAIAEKAGGARQRSLAR